MAIHTYFEGAAAVATLPTYKIGQTPYTVQVHLVGASPVGTVVAELYHGLEAGKLVKYADVNIANGAIFLDNQTKKVGYFAVKITSVTGTPTVKVLVLN